MLFIVSAFSWELDGEYSPLHEGEMSAESEGDSG